jgi:putative hydrolase of the HAD superfamily
MSQVKVIAFDADDTLWVNEPYFRQTEEEFFKLVEDYLPAHSTSRELLKVEINNLPLYGYGIKAFMLSMVETALKISNNTIDLKAIDRIIHLGKQMLDHPVELLPGVEEVLSSLKGKFRLVVATKGDLLDQERKLKKSGLEHFFHHIEIMSDKREADYMKLVKHLDIKPDEFLMIGNSLKSDILPVLNIGGHGIHVPYHITWVHEQLEHNVEHENFREVKQISEVVELLGNLTSDNFLD